MDVKSLEAKNLLCAIEKGYFVDPQGNVFSKNGYKRKLFYRNAKDPVKYYCFSVKIKGSSRKIMVHKLQAYQKFGEAIFEQGIQVRHLDSNSLNNVSDNLALGTAQENSLDIPKEKRLKSGKHAASFNRKFSEEDIKAIRKRHSEGCTQRKLYLEYGCSKSTMSYIINNITYPNQREG